MKRINIKKKYRLQHPIKKNGFNRKLKEQQGMSVWYIEKWNGPCDWSRD
jgi:hypothetical protein